MLGWDLYRFHKKRAETYYTELVFLQPVGCGSCTAFRCMKHQCTIFHAQVGLVWIPQKVHPDDITPSLCVFIHWNQWVR
jgi:hypothetical protein